MDGISQRLKQALLENLDELSSLSADALVKKRYERLMQFGHFTTRIK